MTGYHKVGVLAGMGYHAGCNFLSMLGRELNARGVIQDHQFPEVLVLSLPLRDWDATGALSDSVRGQVVTGVQRLVGAGAELIAVPCNSVHEYYADWALLGAPALHLVRETQRQAAGVLGVLCSAQTRRARLYEEDGRSVVYPADQRRVDLAVEAVLRGGRPYLGALVDEVVAAGADTVVLGCTELSMGLWDTSVPVIDSALVLAQAVAIQCATSS